MRKFTKNDLKTGHIVKLRNGETTILIGDDFKTCSFMTEVSLMWYDDELLIKNNRSSLPEGDIMEVYKWTKKVNFENILDIIAYNDKFLNDLLAKDYIQLIWQRNNEKCYCCNSILLEEYQVMIIEGDLQFVKCCCMDCAEKVKRINEENLYDQYENIKNQSIQILKKKKY